MTRRQTASIVFVVLCIVLVAAAVTLNIGWILVNGRRVAPLVLGVITFGNRVGSAIGPWLGGVIYDLTGSYRYAFVTSIAALGLAWDVKVAKIREEMKEEAA